MTTLKLTRNQQYLMDEYFAWDGNGPKPRVLWRHLSADQRRVADQLVKKGILWEDFPTYTARKWMQYCLK